ncbi:MAG: C39 family peptidase [Anaerolineales bacterium]
MSKPSPRLVLLALLFFLLSLGLYLSGHRDRLAWEYERLVTYGRGLIVPVKAFPTPLATVEELPLPTPSPSPTPESISSTPAPSATPTATLPPLPPQVFLPAPAWEKQDINNCGPATLTMALRMYGWQGDQFDISKIIKPERADRNVNPEEMAYYVNNYAGWLRAEFRVNGNLQLLKRLLAAGFPVIIEEVFIFDETYWPNDDHWAAHYLLLTGYDDTSGTFIGQDSYRGADQVIAYADLDANWQPFNRLYFLVYRPEQEESLRAILGEDWDIDRNRQGALEQSRKETEESPQNAFAWFNYGTNLVYFERYAEAARAYDRARQIGLPQRMTRYQFGPFIAYFHSGRIPDLLALAEYTLQRTPNSEEALLWHGWGLYRQGDLKGAIADWRRALKARPDYPDAIYALQFVGENP